MAERNCFGYLAGNGNGRVRRPEDKSFLERLGEVYKNCIPNDKELDIRKVREMLEKIKRNPNFISGFSDK